MLVTSFYLPSMFGQVVLLLVLIAVAASHPGHLGEVQRHLHEAVYPAEDGEAVVPNEKRRLAIRHYNKRSLSATLAFFVERFNFVPQSFHGKGAQVYIFTK